ncbi:uncharacterized protein IUM83_10822 [Phytophthora cinnamomi]|uniref:uncharacterized protein n=1 Tax=Phytophthora cinnamomi TaxID=4785 RepID=UPI00355A56CE|nr:hypothetical protein IUM83_10822 [Phytophthora cinnamomi]
MDVILAQLGAQELAAHCRDAMRTQLLELQRVLGEALAAAQRAEEVQLASQKLAIALFVDASELSPTLVACARARDELGQTLERVAARAVGAAVSTASSLPKKRKASAEEPSAKKQKRSCSPAPEAPAKAPEAGQKSTAALSRALAAGANLADELAKKKKAADRVDGLKTLVQHFNTAHKHLDANSVVDQVEALDTLTVVALTAVGIMQHGKPAMKRHWVQKFRDNVADVQEQFPESASAFNGCMNALSKIISSFPLTIKEGQQLRVRIRKAYEEVKGWEEGGFTISDVSKNISLITEALESTCQNWNARSDTKVRELTALLLRRVGLLKESKKQAKRKQRLQSWLDEMSQAKEGSKDAPATPKTPPPTAAIAKPNEASKPQKKKKKEKAKTQVTPSKANDKDNSSKKATPRKGSPHLPQTAVVSAPPSSSNKSDSESTQRDAPIKSEVVG